MADARHAILFLAATCVEELPVPAMAYGRANGSPLPLLHIQHSLNSIPFEVACKAWDTERLEPTSVLDLGSPSPSSRAVSSVSGSLDDRLTVSSSSFYEESVKKVHAGSDGGVYLGERTSSWWMAGKALENEVGDNNYKEAVERLHGYSNAVDWRPKQCQRSDAENEQIDYGGSIVSPLLKTEQWSSSGINDKANLETFQNVGFVARPNQPFLYSSRKQGENVFESGSILQENRHDNHNFVTGEGFGSATIANVQDYKSASESVCGLSIRGENNGECRCEEARNRSLDDLLSDLQGCSGFPLHEDFIEALHCGYINLDSMIFNSPAPPVPDHSMMKCLLGENDQIQNMEESLCGAAYNVGLGSKLHLQLQDKIPESTSQLLSPKSLAPTPLQLAGNLKGACSLQSAFSSLESTRASPALAHVSAFPNFTETSLSNFCQSTNHSSVTLLSPGNALPLPSLNSFQDMNIQSSCLFPPLIHNSQDVASRNLGLKVKIMSQSGVLAPHDQMMSSSHDISLNLSDPLCQETFIGQNTLTDSSDQIYSTSRSRKQHPFQLSSLPSVPASQYPVDYYMFNSCQPMNPTSFQQSVSDQLEIPALHQLAGQKNQHPASSPSVRPKLQSYDFWGADPDEGATWHAKVQMESKRMENLCGFKRPNFEVDASHRSSIGFFVTDRRDIEARQPHNVAQAPTDYVDDSLLLVHHLFQLVEALDEGDSGVAHLILARLNQYPLTQNKYIQRVVLYFRDALAARLAGISQSSCQTLSPMEFLQKVTAYYRFCEASPFLSFAHFMANQAILEALEGEESVHVIDFEISFGGQWASFLQDFALKPGNTRTLRITAVGSRQDEMYFTGERLCSFAKDHNILLDFQVVVTKLENLTLEMLRVRVKESIAVNFVLGQHKMLGDSPNSIHTILQIVKGLSPKVVTVVEKELDDNNPNLQARFLETLSYYSSLSELLRDGDLDNGSVMFIEKLLFMPEILDIVICERLARAKKNKGLQCWRQRFLSAGFSNIPLSNLAEMNAHYLIRRNSTYQGYEILKNEGSILLGWRGKSLLAASAWTC